ncbi:MAG: YqgE/AlgH family protein [Prolixibacteraceae bacterium]|nr:YqgE/AlgH family protein [Prolixibacteraceae bacterium]MBN2775489.1 YqgE/AlgH family protein [Prolixibacteraceae bacterium]
MDQNLDIFKIRSNNLKPEKGRILIAEPFLTGSYFNRSVVFLVAYSDKGAVGFILNKKVDFPIHDIISDFPEFNANVYIGGPVATDSIYYIHKLGNQVSGSIKVSKNLYWGGDFEDLKRLITTGIAKPTEVRFFLGYSGWDSGQLDEELKENSWLVNDVNDEIVMKDLSQSSWIDFVKMVGKKYQVWEHFPENPSMN